MLLFRIQCALSVSVEVLIAGIFHNSDCWKITETTLTSLMLSADMPSDLNQYLTQVQLGFTHENGRKIFQLNLRPLYGKNQIKYQNEYLAIVNGFLMSVHTIDS